MNEYYEDIISKIKEKPQWFDEFAVPRYCRFSPGLAEKSIPKAGYYHMEG